MNTGRSLTTRLPLLLTAATALVLAGCNGTTGGGPPAENSTNQSGSSDNNSAAGRKDPLSDTSSLKPCNLLTKAEISQNQLGSGGASSGSGARSCSWTNTTTNNYAGYSVKVDVRDHQGIKDINSDGLTVTTDNIGDHSAKQLTGGSTCTVVIGVTGSSRVDISSTDSSGDITNSCRLVNQFAKLVEPKLPGGG